MPRTPCALITAGLALALGGPLAAQVEVQRDATVVLTPFQSTTIVRALDSRFSCVGCHRIGGRGGAIGPSLDGIGLRTDPAYVLNMIVDPAGTVPGTLMPTQRLPRRDARRLATYLRALPPDLAVPDTNAEAPAPLDPANREVGAALYARHCAACHGETGGGDGWNAPNLPVMPTVHADAERMARRADDSLFDAIHSGGFVLDKSPLMPAFRSLLSPTQIRALVRHIRVLCDCSQPAWAGREW